MKDESFIKAVAVTIDQRSSRTGDDRVPQLLVGLDEALAGRVLLPPERTAGDEVQFLCDDAPAVVDAVAAVLRMDGWRVGIGVGEVELPLPDSTRAARGPAYIAAREALSDARQSPWQLALKTVGGAAYGDAMTTTGRDAETSLLLLAHLCAGRTAQGWEVVDLLQGGKSVAQVADELGISPSAVSQRHRRAGWDLEGRTRELAVHHVDALLTLPGGAL